MINIETERLLFREINDDDYDNLKAIICDEETMKYYPKPYDSDGVNRWINWCKSSYEKEGFGLWALISKKDNTFIGDCGISMQNINGKIVPEIGYHINKKHWRSLYASEAAKACKKWFFLNSKYTEVYSYMNKDNIGSRKVAEKNGMKLVEEFIQEGVKHCVYCITKEEYLNSIK